MLFTSDALKIASFKIIQAKRSFVKCGDWFTEISHLELRNRVSSSIRVVEQLKNCLAISEDTVK